MRREPFLLDTMVLSELQKRQRDPAVAGWLAARNPEDVFLSVVSIGEVERGVAGAGCRMPSAMVAPTS